MTLLVCHEYRVMHSGRIFLLTPVVLLRCSLICLIAAIASAADSNASRPFFIRIALHLAAPESLWLIDGDEIWSRRHWRLSLSADNKSDCDRPHFFSIVLAFVPLSHSIFIFPAVYSAGEVTQVAVWSIYQLESLLNLANWFTF